MSPLIAASWPTTALPISAFKARSASCVRFSFSLSARPDQPSPVGAENEALAPCGVTCTWGA